ncbi:MAG TPA: RNA polymerase sigma factor RpoH [Methylophilaceae bacterium]|jgi:RNA polymerase sigma-32 factor|nr:RNA polymerase sigma factor RpoH [Methylophilaceae bacterium]|tara:strand:+ start:2611 stop:3468 length:858 start_codon:yes stop_codon:yes gene_type:complete
MTNNLSITAFHPLGDFDLLQNTIRSIPSLTADEEYELAIRLKRNNDLEAAKKLILSHLKLVMKIARSYSGYNLPHADLVQEGNIGLMKAVKRFDPDRGVRLVSFAIYWIKAEIQEYVVRNWRLVKTATTKAQRKLFFNLRSLKKTLKPLKGDEIKAIALELNVKEDEVREMEFRLSGQEISIDYSDDESEDDYYRPISYLQDSALEQSDQIEKDETESNGTESLKTALSKLDERSKAIVQSRWLTEDKSATLHELALRYNVSAERVRQIEQNALKKIKALMLNKS